MGEKGSVTASEQLRSKSALSAVGPTGRIGWFCWPGGEANVNSFIEEVVLELNAA